MKTREEIQSQVEILHIFFEDKYTPPIQEEVEQLIKNLELQLKQAKSIKDLQEEAFNAGRHQSKIDNWECEDPADWYYFTLKTFEDYLKTKENEK